MEGSEFGSWGREGRESDEDPEQPENNEREFDPEEIQRKAKEMVEAAERDDGQEPDIDGPEKDPGERAEKEAKEEEEKQDDAPKGELDEQEPSDEKKGGQDESSKPEEPEKEESPEKEDNTPQEEPEAEEVETPVKDAIKELEREEEELRRTREEREAREQEVEEAKERAREEREASADQYPYDDLEKWVRDTLEKHGVSAEDLENQWHDRFVEDIAEELEGKTEPSEAQEEETDEDAKSSGEGKAQEGSSYYEDGSGQMYAVEHDSSTSSEAKQETEGAMEGQEESQNTTESPESETKESSEPSEPLDDKESQQENSETRELESEPQGERTEEPQKQLEGEMDAEASETSETTPESKKKEIEQSVTSSTHETQERTPETVEKTPDKSDEKEPEPATESKEELDDSEPSGMFPEGMPKRGTMIPESRSEKEQRWEEYVDKMWEELTEEEREEFKKKIRSVLKDEEDLEELLKRHGSEHLLENEDAMTEISQYLEFQKRLDEELENGTDRESAVERIADELEIEQGTAEKWAQYEELPDELHDLMARETQWLWHQKMRAIAEMVYPTNLEEIDESLDSETRNGVEAWFEIREMKENGEIEFIVRDNEELYNIDQVKDLSFKYGISEREILYWLRGKTIPNPTKEYVKSKLKEIDEFDEASFTKDEYGMAIHLLPETRFQKSFAEKHNEIIAFFKLQDMLENSEINLREFAASNNLPYDKVVKWSKKQSRPHPLEKMQVKISRMMYVEVHGRLPEIRIDAVDDILSLLDIHTDLRLISPDVLEKYFRVRNDWSMTENELAKKYGISPTMVYRWRNKIEPPLIATLRRKEEERVITEWVQHINPRKILKNISEVYSKNKLDVNLETSILIPESIIETILSNNKSSKWDLDLMIDSIVQICKNLPPSNSHIHIASFIHPSTISNQSLEQIEELFDTNIDLIAETVREKLSMTKDDDSLRLGFVGGHLYIWKPDLNPWKLINAYGTAVFQLKNRSELANLVTKIKQVLDTDESEGLYNTLEQLEQLLSQLFPDYKHKSYISIRYHQITGKSLHLFLDILGIPLSSLENRISKIYNGAGGGGIVNPRFPEGEELEELFARVIALVISDGHLYPNGVIEYSEPNIERIKIVEKYLQALGDIVFNPVYYKDDNYYKTPISNIIGNALMHLGLISGDKTIQNPDLFPSFLELCWNALCAFFEELIPQDGSVTSTSISCTHSMALHPGQKKGNPIISSEEVEFIKSKGTSGKKNTVLLISELIDLMESKNPETARIARKLKNHVFENPNRFIKFEEKIAMKIGVKVKTVPYTIRYHYKSGRVSVAWYLFTESVYYAIKLAMIAPPNDRKKRQIMKDAIKKRPEIMKRVLSEIKQKGIYIDKWWDKK